MGKSRAFQRLEVLNYVCELWGEMSVHKLFTQMVKESQK